jgi:isopentenyl-diphosphate delta-isomerase
MEWVTLVDEASRKCGKAEKLEAHRNGGLLHLAFSILVVNPAGKLLVQQRAAGKYHFANRWSNTCCGHPRPDESTTAAAHRRLEEELGFATPLHRQFSFFYQCADEVSGFAEKEYLHVFVGNCSATPNPDPKEIKLWRWEHVDLLKQEIRDDPLAFTPWFRLLLDRLPPLHTLTLPAPTD